MYLHNATITNTNKESINTRDAFILSRLTTKINQKNKMRGRIIQFFSMVSFKNPLRFFVNKIAINPPNRVDVEIRSIFFF